MTRSSGAGLLALLLLVLGALLPTSGRAAGEGEFQPPSGLETERYAPIWERSPFELKTAAAALTNVRSFAENLALAGLSDVEGRITVYLKNKVSGEYTKLTNAGGGEEPVDGGLAFEGIVEDSDPRQVKVKIRKGTERAEVGYPPEGMGVAAAAGSAGAGAGRAATPAGVLGRPGAPGSQQPGAQGIVPPGKQNPAAVQPTRRRIILPQQSAPQASSTTAPEVRQALLDTTHADSPAHDITAQVLPPP